MDKQRLLKGILNYIECCGGLDNSWFAGISRDKEFFQVHGHSEAEDLWIGGCATSPEGAIQVLNGLQRLGVKGPEEAVLGGERKFVYVYRRTPRTSP
jgi:hypothetical protein